MTRCQGTSDPQVTHATHGRPFAPARDTGERRDLTVGRDFAAGNFCDDRIDAGVRRHFFPFLPSFLFILCGAALVEATHGDRKFTAPLTAITAAAEGFVNLAVFFAWHVLRPAGTDAAPFASHPEDGRDRPKRALPAPARPRITGWPSDVTVPVADQR